MSEPTDSPPGPAGARIRPFLDRPPLPATLPSPGSPPPGSPRGGSTGSVRAYLITGGRTESAEALEFETMLSVTALGRAERAGLSFERARIAELCAESPQSVAELAAKLNIPITVARVLAADMVGSGWLDKHAGQSDLADDVDMLQRLIHGIRTL